MRLTKGSQPKPVPTSQKDGLHEQHFKMIKDRSVNSLIIHLNRKDSTPDLRYGSKNTTFGDPNTSLSRLDIKPEHSSKKQSLLLMKEIDEIFFPVRGVGVPSNRTASRLPVKPTPPPPSYPLIDRMRAKYDQLSLKDNRPERTLPMSGLQSELSAQLFSPHEKHSPNTIATTQNTTFLIRRHSTPHISSMPKTAPNPLSTTLQTSESNPNLLKLQTHNAILPASGASPNTHKNTSTQVRFQPIAGFPTSEPSDQKETLQMQQNTAYEQQFTTKTATTDNTGVNTAKTTPASKLPKKFRMLMASIRNAESKHLDLLKSAAQDAGIYDEASTVEIFLYRESTRAHESEIISQKSSALGKSRAKMLNLSATRGLEEMVKPQTHQMTRPNTSAYKMMTGPTKFIKIRSANRNGSKITQFNPHTANTTAATFNHAIY